MFRRLVLTAACLLPVACAGGGQPFVPDTARLAPGALGSGFDPDVTAVNLAQWAFADSGRTRGRSIEAARAAASMDYIAGQLYTSPRWSNISALTKEQLLQGRQRGAGGAWRGAGHVVPSRGGPPDDRRQRPRRWGPTGGGGATRRPGIQPTRRSGAATPVEHAVPAHGERIHNARGRRAVWPQRHGRPILGVRRGCPACGQPQAFNG